MRGPELFEANEAYLRWIQEIVHGEYHCGLSTLEVASKTDLGELAGLLDPERLVGNLHRAYAELAPRGAIDTKPACAAHLAQTHDIPVVSADDVT